jgi:hypothetical protein
LRLDGQLVTGPAREELAEKVGAAVIDDAPGEKARRAVAEVCSPYRRQFASGEWPGELTALNADRAGGDLTPISGLEGVPGGRAWPRLQTGAALWGSPPSLRGAGRSWSRRPAGRPKMEDQERWT